MAAAHYAPGDVLAGTVYRVVRHLATGGMGSVYDVEDVTVEKRYVLKTLHPQLVSREDLARRMRDEARSLAKLQHPNIVDVITAGVTTDATRLPFYVMERLIGQNLRVVLEKRGALDAAHAYRIGIDVADALDHAHEHHLVHRDVKPENIFLHRNSNGTTTTKLLDFGIVRLLDRKASHTHGKFVGTLRYASPEQIVGRAIGRATDIYSLGLVVYEMLCGRGPFDDAGDQFAISSAHAGQPPPPLSRFVRVPAEVERFVASMLEKDPERRPRDCFLVAGELRRFLQAHEQIPRWVTEVNVLSAAAPSIPPLGTTHGPAVAGAPGPDADGGPTVTGMIPPSTGQEADAMAGAEGHPVSPVAPTLAVAGNPDITVGSPRASQPSAPPPRVIDRHAPTRMSAPLGATQRLAPNDTRVEVELANDDALRAAFGEPAPLVVPPTGGGSSPGEMVFPPLRPHAGTGPLAGEARTRPPTRRGGVTFVAAGLGVAALVGGIYLLGATASSRVMARSSSMPNARPGAAFDDAVTTVVAPASSTKLNAAAPGSAGPSPAFSGVAGPAKSAGGVEVGAAGTARPDGINQAKAASGPQTGTSSPAKVE